MYIHWRWKTFSEYIRVYKAKINNFLNSSKIFFQKYLFPRVSRNSKHPRWWRNVAKKKPTPNEADGQWIGFHLPPYILVNFFVCMIQTVSYFQPLLDAKEISRMRLFLLNVVWAPPIVPSTRLSISTIQNRWCHVGRGAFVFSLSFSCLSPTSSINWKVGITIFDSIG